MPVTLSDGEGERALKIALSRVATLERQVTELQLKRDPEPPAPLSDEAMKKLELKLDASDTEMVVRVLRGIEVCLEQSREKLLKSRQMSQSRDCEHRRQEVVVLLKKLERT